MSPFVSKIQCNHRFSPQQWKFITEFCPAVWAHVVQTDRFTNLFPWNCSPRVCWPCIRPAGYSDVLQCRGGSDCAQVSSCSQGCLIGHLPHEHSSQSPVSWSPQHFHDAHTSTFGVNVPRWRVFVNLPCLSPRTLPNEKTLLFFFKEKYSPLYMKWMHLEQNCSMKSSIYSRSQMQVFKHLRLHRSTYRRQLSNIPCSAMPGLLQTLSGEVRWNLEDSPILRHCLVYIVLCRESMLQAKS